jgi:hypothetical protein
MVNVVGDIKRSTKFYIIDSKNSIQWVPSYELAEAYVLDSSLVEWYGKTIYCTNEDFAYNDEGLCVLASSLTTATRGNKRELLNNLRQQFDEFAKERLNEIAIEHEYENYSTAISWINSSVEKYRKFAEQLLQYRDRLYIHIEETQEALEKISPEHFEDFDTIIEKFQKDLPVFEEEA